MLLRSYPGYSLVEMATLLVVVAIGTSVLASYGRRLVDRAEAVAAREEVVRGVARARAFAVARGGASVTLVAQPPALRIDAGSEVVRAVPLGGGDRRLSVALTSGRDSLTLRFDRLGIGRFANGTILLRRGDATRGLVISSYGRVRRR